MTWIEAVLDKIAYLWPLTRIEVWQRGIRFTYLPRYWRLVYDCYYHRWPFFERVQPGVVVTRLDPGVHRKLPWLDEVQAESVVERSWKIDLQSITTADDKPITFTVNVQFELDDVEANLTQVDHFERSMESTCQIHLARRIRKMTWLELLGKQDDLESSLKNTLTTRVKKWGVKVLDVGFTDLSQTPSYRVYGKGIL